jgi:pimeloyl-ACP methyl ester carboxylesterase
LNNGSDELGATEVAELLGHPNCTIQDQLIDAADGFQLRVITFTPTDAKAAARAPVMLVPGWTSVIEGWEPLLRKWTQQRLIHYIETREKVTAHPPEGRKLTKHDFTMDKNIADLVKVAESLEINMNEVDWFASSLGASAVLDGLAKGELQGRSAFMLAPNTEFKFPLWTIPFTWLPWWFYPPALRYILTPYLKWKLKEEKQFIRYRRTLRNAHVYRLKRSVQANKKFKLAEDLSNIHIPVAICVASSDVMHAEGAAHNIAAKLPKGELVEVPSNQYAHEAEVISDIDEWLVRNLSESN